MPKWASTALAGLIVVSFMMLAAAQQTERRQTISITKGPVVSGITANSATIEWWTNVAATTGGLLGREENHINEPLHGPGGEPTHKLQVSKLSPGTTYYFEVESHSVNLESDVARAKGSFQTLAK